MDTRTEPPKAPDPLEARLSAGLTQKELAERAGVSEPVIVRAEQGLPIRKISQSRIARALGFDRLELFPEDQEASA